MNTRHEARRKALGRGLASLIPPRVAPATDAHTTPGSAGSTESFTEISIDLIDPNPAQPRKVFQAEKLQELAQSIRANGIIQPVVVRKNAERYQVVAGERRWRAARMAGVQKLPVLIQDVPDDRLLEMTLIENIQREDLNPIEAAMAFTRLVNELGLSHDEIGRRTGKDRSTITNLLRLLQLPPDLQDLVAERRLSPGHARALLSLASEQLQRELAERAVAQGLSVRQVERLTQRMNETREPKRPDQVELDPNVKAAIEELERVLATRVRIVEKSNRRGRIEIDYFSADDLDRIYSIIIGQAQSAT